jgi:hypothetical protein
MERLTIVGVAARFHEFEVQSHHGGQGERVAARL